VPETRIWVPAAAGTLRTDGPTFTIPLDGVIILTAGLTLLPALALGPIVEALAH
jgi:K+-transporting ATPase ATPase A chain